MSQRITIEIKDKIATCLTELPVVCGNADYVVDFAFDEEWNEHEVKTAIFVVNGKATPQVFAGNVCPIPVIQNTLIVWVGVFAGTVDDGTLSTSTPALVKCIPCITDGDNIPMAPPDDVYNQIIALINAGMLKGEPFTYEDFTKEQLAELKGEDGKDGETPDMSAYYTKAETDKSIAKVENEIAFLGNALLQSGTIYKGETEEAYTERVTADGLNVLDGSKAVLKNVVGNTVKCNQLFIAENIVKLGENGHAVFDETENAYLIPLTGAYYYGNNKYLYEYQGKENTQYTFTAEIKQGTAVNIVFVFHYADGTTSNVSNRIKPTNYTLYSATSEAGKTLTAISLNYQNGGSMYFKNARLNEGTADLGYQPYFTGLKSASFAGLESTNADSTETATLDFPKTETPLGTTIDFETKKITDYGVDLVLTGTEAFSHYLYQSMNGIFCSGLCQAGNKPVADYVSTDSTRTRNGYPNGDMWCGYTGSTTFFWIGILDILGFATKGIEMTAEEKETAIASFKAYLSQRYADGNPVKIRYLSSVLQSETDFTADNEYTAWKNGTEKVLGNDNTEYGANNTLTQNYILVKE